MHEYEHATERDPQQFLYGAGNPWTYMTVVSAVLCEQIKSLKAAFGAADPRLQGIVNAEGDGTWRDVNSQDIHESYGLILPTSNGAILFPATREGVEEGARLTFPTIHPWCRLFFDDNFRARLIDGTLGADGFYDQISRTFSVGIGCDYERLFLFEGPQFSQVRPFLDSAIDQASRAHS